MSETTEVGERLVRIETKFDLFIDRFDKSGQDIEKRASDHEMRLRSLEQFRWLLLGASMAAGGTAGALASAFGLG